MWSWLIQKKRSFSIQIFEVHKYLLIYNRYYISFEKYSRRIGQSFWNIRLFIDGERIKLKDTPKILELEQNGVIEVFIHQTGGNGNTGPTEES